MKRKGFTLIELLAVILILGIIALIAIPTVNNIINEARKGSFKSTVQNVLKAAETKCQLEKVKGSELTLTYTFSNSGVTPALELKGKLPTGGTISVDNDCNVTLTNATDGKYRAFKSSTSDNIIIAEVGGKVCQATVGDGTHIGDEITCGTESFYVYDTTGDSIKMLAKYNLKVGGVCDGSTYTYTPYSESETGYNMQDANMRGWVDGQPEWNGVTTFSLEEQHGEKYSSYNGSIVEQYVDEYKEKLTAMGMNVEEARLITKEELIGLGCNEKIHYCNPENGGTAPAWVHSTSYWSGSAYDTSLVWSVFSNGDLYNDYYDDYVVLGVRPVVIISKSEI